MRVRLSFIPSSDTHFYLKRNSLVIWKHDEETGAHSFDYFKIPLQEYNDKFLEVLTIPSFFIPGWREVKVSGMWVIGPDRTIYDVSPKHLLRFRIFKSNAIPFESLREILRGKGAITRKSKLRETSSSDSPNNEAEGGGATEGSHKVDGAEILRTAEKVIQEQQDQLRNSKNTQEGGTFSDAVRSFQEAQTYPDPTD